MQSRIIVAMGHTEEQVSLLQNHQKVKEWKMKGGLLIIFQHSSVVVSLNLFSNVL